MFLVWQNYVLVDNRATCPTRDIRKLYELTSGTLPVALVAYICHPAFGLVLGTGRAAGVMAILMR